MGMDPATLTALIAMAGQIGAGALAGGLQPSPFQERHTFSGSPVNPVTGMFNAQEAIRNVLAGAIDHVNSPLNLSSDVGDVPSFSGGGLPMPIGVVGAKRKPIEVSDNFAPLKITPIKGYQNTPGDPNNPDGNTIPTSPNPPASTGQAQPQAMRPPEREGARRVAYKPPSAMDLGGNELAGTGLSLLSGGGDGDDPAQTASKRALAAVKLLMHTSGAAA